MAYPELRLNIQKNHPIILSAIYGAKLKININNLKKPMPQ
jgi:hypothetical protein